MDVGRRAAYVSSAAGASYIGQGRAARAGPPPRWTTPDP